MSPFHDTRNVRHCSAIASCKVQFTETALVGSFFVVVERVFCSTVRVWAPKKIVVEHSVLVAAVADGAPTPPSVARIVLGFTSR